MTAKTETRRAKLTAASAKITLPKGVDDLIVKDTDLVGFQLRIRKASRRWIFSGRVKNGPRRQVILGDAELIPCALARTKAVEHRVKFMEGFDPVAVAQAAAVAKAAVASGRTFNSVADEYLLRWSTGTMGRHKPRPASIATTPYTLLRARAAFGDKDIKSITSADARGFYNSLIIDGDIAGATAAKNWATTTLVFKFAFTQGLIDTNPTLGFDRPQSAGARDRVLSHDEIKMVWNAAGTLGRAGQLVRFLITTPLRLSMARLADWSMVSLSDRTITITADAEGNKAGKSMVLPLNDLAVEVLEELPFRSGPVFPGRSGRPVMFADRAKTQLDEKSGVTDWRLHDLRRTVATQTGDYFETVDEGAFELWLQHTRKGIVAVYQQAARTKAMRTVANQWDIALRDILGMPPATNNVVPMVAPTAKVA